VVAYIEIINEQSILFYVHGRSRRPTLRRQVATKLRLSARGTQDRSARPGDSFDGFANDGFPPVGEHLDKNNILPIGNPWYWDPAQLNGSQAFRRQRLIDTLVFLYGLQCEFYDRYVQAMRDAGYEGEILGSNWQAGQALATSNLHWTGGSGPSTHTSAAAAPGRCDVNKRPCCTPPAPGR
jgi:hypothetical protein